MKKEEFIRVRVAGRQKKYISLQAEKAHKSLSQYVRDAAMDKDVTVIDGVDDLIRELRRQGNTNDFLERNGSPERIDHRSNAERGIDEIPTVHMGVAACQMEKKRKTRRNQFGAGQEISFVKAVGTIRQENRQGRGKLPLCMPQSECGAGHTGYRIFSDPLPGGSQDTGGAFRSRVQRPGVRHRSVGAGHTAPCGSVLTWHK